MIETVNASKISNADTDRLSYGEVQLSSDSYRQHSRMTEKGRSLLEDYREIPYKVSRLNMEGPQTEERYEYEPRSISEMAKHLTEDDYQRLGAQLRSKKSSILNSVLDIIPDNLKYEAKCICDRLIQNDSIFFNDKKELIVGGEVIPNSNICTKMIEELTSYPNPGTSIQPTRNETKSTKCMLKTRVPRNETRKSESRKSRTFVPKSRNPSRIIKFVSLFDGKKDKDDGSETDSEENGGDDDDDDDDYTDDDHDGEETCDDEDG